MSAFDDRSAETPDASFHRRLLIESLTVLPADAQSQIAWLDRRGVVTDEIAPDFDHAFGIVEALGMQGTSMAVSCLICGRSMPFSAR
ncbi:hypothetical protein M2160_008153 [Streptomyces sp. SAI-117]|uniref:hypothetical protein n=1 Tax=unclassified Streptomyces TaxID=2593676 RepID=UPI002473C908|nr:MULTISPECIES: hypothetical protein [unclassified Streptomyces]MDH6554055.1 hypothetical protein [Streptomyces sp. SAI-041]MDH6573132.1 hypothetical protein [Streptomyces sp. SAI-117]